LLKLLHRWREEAEKAGRRIERTAVVNWIRGAPPELDAVRAGRRREDGID
jgi:hypothetical protein